MKKRDKFWLNRLLLLSAVIILFIFVSLYNILQFNASFIKDEIKELEIFRNQTQWAVTEILKRADDAELQKYGSNYRQYKEFSFRVFDEDKKLIVSSSDNNAQQIAPDDKRLKKIKFNIWDLYKFSFKDKILESTSTLEINSKKYYIEVSISQDYVISSIIAAQKNIILLFALCFILLLLSIVHILFSIRNSFNKLEDSVIKISKGQLDTKIEIPQNGLLEELALSIISMTRKLKMQIERLSKLEKYQTEFIQNITHEIKTPITAINSAAELIQSDNNISETAEECINIINFQTNALNKLVNDILELGEIDLKKTEEIKTFQIVNVMKAAEEAANYQGIADCKINIIKNSDAVIKADKELLITAVSNLLSNALKYSKSSVIDIIISKNVLEIKDYGIGIEEKHLERIFERFYRIDKSRSKKKGGTGLGLSIVKNIAELHNWKIEVKSEVNRGTSFKIIFC